VAADPCRGSESDLGSPANQVTNSPASTHGVRLNNAPPIASHSPRNRTVGLNRNNPWFAAASSLDSQQWNKKVPSLNQL
jgi:hypothetical protein